MAKNTKTQHSKPKTFNIFRCCFGSNRPNNKASTKASTVKGSDPILKKKRRSSSWFVSSWRKIIRINTKSTSKTVPLEPSFSHVKVKAHYSKTKSKSSTHKSQPQKTIPPPPSQLHPVLPATPYYSPPQTRHGANSKNTEDTREQSRVTPTRAKRQERRVPSSPTLSQTTPKNPQNARGTYDSLVGMSVLMVTLVIMVFWGRLGAVVCTSAWLYFIPRFRKNVDINDIKPKANDVDLDSEEYKRKVIMEGLLGRDHRGGGGII